MSKFLPTNVRNLKGGRYKQDKEKVGLMVVFLVVLGLFLAQQNNLNFGVIVAQAKELFVSDDADYNNKGEKNAREDDDFYKIKESFLRKDIPLEIYKNDKMAENMVAFQAKSEFELELEEMTAGHPIQEMIPFISKYDKKVASLIIGIAKKESNWGKRSPSKNGKTCYNYWGYKGRASRGSALGYACFSSPEEAIEIVGGRIQKLVGQGLNTPAKMIVWKCGRSCAGHNPVGVRKWISDVGLYYNKIAMK